jgi:predicted GNAT superfamily acetyltransferase
MTRVPKLAGYAIREPRGIEEFAQLAGVFKTVFRLSDLATPPAWLMEDSTKVGGLTLGLWHGNEAVGFSYALPGLDEGDAYLYSSGLGVLPEHRSQGQAVAMKIVQRERALERGFTRMSWTYSALRSVNAHIYITGLGGIGSKYVVDNRGSFDTDWQTEGGVPLDEFAVDWHLDSQRVRSRLADGAPGQDLGSIPVITHCSGSAPSVVLDRVDELPGTDRVAVEVPPDFQSLVNETPALAQDWRSKTRPVFVKLLEARYALTECIRDAATGRVHYIFEQVAA